MYAATKELKKKAFSISSQNIEQVTGILLTFISEIKPQKVHFLAKYDCFFRDLCLHFEPLLGSEFANVSYYLRIEKEGIQDK